MNNAFGIPQRVLVLGATSDIAAAIATGLAQAGTQEFILAARRPDELGAVTAVLTRAGARRIEPVAFDALRHEQHGPLIDGLWATNDHIDLVLVAFGVLGDRGDVDSDHGDPATVALTNYVGALTALDAVSRRMEAQGFGTIVVLSSVAAERPRADNYLYASSKAGLDAYAQGLGDALAPEVRVMIVRPGFVTTRMTAGLEPAPFATTPAAVAEDVLSGLASGADIVWSPRVVRGVMSALRHLPRPAYRRVVERSRH